MFALRLFTRFVLILAVVFGAGVALAWAWDRSEAPAGTERPAMAQAAATAPTAER